MVLHEVYTRVGQFGEMRDGIRVDLESFGSCNYRFCCKMKLHSVNWTILDSRGLSGVAQLQLGDLEIYFFNTIILSSCDNTQ